jgi:hypothetical protein
MPWPSTDGREALHGSLRVEIKISVTKENLISSIFLAMEFSPSDLLHCFQFDSGNFQFDSGQFCGLLLSTSDTIKLKVSIINLEILYPIVPLSPISFWLLNRRLFPRAFPN